MFHNYLVAALRNLARNKLYAAINIVGLAVGFAAAILIALFVRDEFSYDKWLPDGDRTFLLVNGTTEPGRPEILYAPTPNQFAAWMKLDFPSIEKIARLSWNVTNVRHGDVEANEEHFYWADPAIFTILQLPAVAGDLKTALDRPDGIVITRRMARKYFGKDAPLGEQLELTRTHVMTVTAVLEDLPSNTHLIPDFIASGLAQFSEITKNDTNPECAVCYEITPYTYLRLKPGASIAEIQGGMQAFLERHRHEALAYEAPLGVKHSFLFLPLRNIHLHPGIEWSMKPPGDPAVVYAIAGIGVLIVLVAGINFVNLMTARATRRSIEIGVRKASGARRRDLVVQFIGESIIYSGVSVVLAVALVELLLPQLNAFLDRTIAFDWWKDPAAIGVIAGSIVLVGASAGAYPALVLSSFRPASVLKGGVAVISNSGSVRQALVVLQFAILIGLIVATLIIGRQTSYALTEGARLSMDQMLRVTTLLNSDGAPPTTYKNKAFQEAVSALPGVQGTAYSNGDIMGGESNLDVTMPDGSKIDVAYVTVDFGFLELYGLRPLAGRFFDRKYGGDSMPLEPNQLFQASLVINETAVRRLGFASPADAIGKTVILGDATAANPSEIIGVTPDFSLDSIHRTILPMLYFVSPRHLDVLHVKLTGRDLPETLKAIDKAWALTGAPRPIARIFLNEYVRDLFRDLTRQSQLFTAFAGVALFIAGLGLFGLSAFTVERRTKEIGIRKAMGANRFDIVKLLVWQFTKPVLWANLIAWPFAYYFMNRWLHGFPYHVDLELWIFLAAAALALAIALATVSTHAFLVARARPVTALRCE